MPIPAKPRPPQTARDKRFVILASEFHAAIARALIRGETPQYEVLAHAVAQGLAQVSVERGIPVPFGVIVATTVAQAKARAGGSFGNRGAEAALAALAVLRLFETL